MFEVLKQSNMHKMKTFKDLKFTDHKVVPNAVQARMDFENGQWISVVGGGSGLYGNGTTSFEIMSSVTENTWQGVRGWVNKKQISDHMRYLQKK